MRGGRIIACVLMLAGAAGAWAGDEWLVLPAAGKGGRVPVHTDAVEAEIVAGRWTAPQAGDEVRAPDGTVHKWEAAAPGKDGGLRHKALEGGYACWTVTADEDKTMILAAAGHSLVYVNGEPRVGDPYSTGYVRVPVRLRAGPNTFLFVVGRGQVRAKLEAAKSDAVFNTDDATLPDVIRGETRPLWGVVPVLNTTDAALTDLVVEAGLGEGEPSSDALPRIPPLTLRKVGFRIPVTPAAADANEAVATLKLRRGEDGPVLDTATIKLGVRNPTDRHKRTFVSEVDGSVQYYAVTPAHPEPNDAEPLGLVITLHGASVEATGQAAAYGHKTWCHVVAPTNRRPYGFDWEDIGRLDAFEVLRQATQRWQIDPRRVYLTGHSMGGHGVWQVGATCPRPWAAIGAAAAWPDFWSYAGAAEYENPTPVEKILLRAVAPSRTLTLERNLLHYGVYVLHGDQDETVPVELARKMRHELGEFHPDFAYKERPGGGHWWGNDAVDWPPMFEFFREHERAAAETVRHVEFHTANPGISATCDWVTIGAQVRMCEPSSVVIDVNAPARKFTGTTQNVARLALNLSELGRSRTREQDGKTVDATVLPGDKPLTVELDGQTLADVAWPGDGWVWLSRAGDNWSVAERPSAALKGPHRYGPFKHVFANHFMFVYGTAGTPEENAAAYNKARYDAETFWYRGNGSVDVIPDLEFHADESHGRNVVLYGNADTNAAWKSLLADSPVQVRRGVVTIGDRDLKGDDLACLFVRPRPNDDVALVGVVGGTGVPGLRLTERLPYFLAGVAYPDCIVLGTDVLTHGTAGVRTAGFFGLDWAVASGEFAWE